MIQYMSGIGQLQRMPNSDANLTRKMEPVNINVKKSKIFEIKLSIPGQTWNL